MLSTPIILRVFIRTYQRMNFTTAYEYLEMRFSLPVRLLGSGLFILTRIGWMSTLLYALSLVLSAVSGIHVTICIVAVGAFSTAYTFVGGMRAVIWTDVIQFFTLMVGIVVIFWVTIAGAGGPIAVLRIGADNDMFKLSFALDPTVRVTFWTAIIGSFFFNLATYGTDQLTLQRVFATKDYKQARRSVLLNNLVLTPTLFLFYFMGVALLAYYKVHPSADVAGLKGDKILPFFIAHQLPTGLVGLLLAALFAAAMSSVDSGLNSLSACTLTDFYKRLSRRERSDKHYTVFAKLVTLVFGVVVIAVGVYVAHFGKSIIETLMGFMGPFFGALLAIFLMGILTRRANSPGAFAGGAVAAVVTLCVARGTKVSPFWFCALSTIVGVAVGMPVSWLTAPPNPDKTEGLTIYRPSHEL